MAGGRQLLAAVMMLSACSRAGAAQTAALELLGSGEFWETDAGSRLLARNGGTPAVEGRLDAWGVVRPHHAVTVRALLEGSAGEAEGASELEVYELVGRIELHPALALEAGRIILPIGAFALRRFASSNPLIGSPDAYPTVYPRGGQVSGRLGPLDYRGAIVDLPVLNERYFPAPGRALRPVAALGVRTGPDFRIGVSGTVGPYLGHEVQASLPAGADREAFHQRVLGVEAQYSRGHLETWGELVWSSYDVPTIAGHVDGLGGYVEFRLTLTPRLFLAGRFERNRYVFVLPVDSTRWVGVPRTVLDGEVAVGYRLTRDFLAKASYRRDYWPEVPAAGGPPFPDGYAVAVQLSYFVDAAELLTGHY